MSTRVGIYARVSTDEQAEEGHSIDAQIRVCRELCARKGWEVVAEYLDPGISGTTTDRPGFQQMLRDARAHKLDVIVVHKLDRFSRSLVDTLTTLAKLSGDGIAFCSATEDFDFTTPIGKVLLALLAAFAQYFVDNLRMETKKGLKERTLKGLYNGTLVFGYQRVPKEQGGVPVFHPHNLKGYYAAVRMALQGKNNRMIADWLNAAGYRTTGNRGNNLFIPDNIADMLRSRFYLGMVSYKGVWRQGKHKAAIDAETWERVQMSLRQRSSHRETTKQTDRVYPLRKILYCAACGKPLRGQPSHGVRKYKDMEAIARRCQQPQSVKAEDIEQQIAEFLRGATLPQDWRKQILDRLGTGTDRAHLETQRKRLINELARARKLYIAGDLPDGEWSKEKTRVQAQLDTLKPVALPDYEKTAALLESAGTLWANASDAQRMELARALFEKVWLEGGNVVAIEPRAAFYPLLALAGENRKSPPIKSGDSGNSPAEVTGVGSAGDSPIIILSPGSSNPGARDD